MESTATDQQFNDQVVETFVGEMTKLLCHISKCCWYADECPACKRLRNFLFLDSTMLEFLCRICETKFQSRFGTSQKQALMCDSYKFQFTILKTNHEIVYTGVMKIIEQIVNEYEALLMNSALLLLSDPGTTCSYRPSWKINLQSQTVLVS